MIAARAHEHAPVHESTVKSGTDEPDPPQTNTAERRSKHHWEEDVPALYSRYVRWSQSMEGRNVCWMGRGVGQGNVQR